MPSSVFQSGVLSVGADALKVLAVLHYVHKAMKRYKHDDLATVKIGQKKLMERTGYSRRTVSAALKVLSEAGYIEVVPDRKGSRKNGSGVAEYILYRTDTRAALLANNESMRGNNVLAMNGCRYFTFPSAVITQSNSRWSLAQMSGSELRLYVAILWQAGLKQANKFEINTIELRKISGLSPATFAKALLGLQVRGLIMALSAKTSWIWVCDPFTGEPIHTPDGDEEDDPANWFTTNAKGVTQRLVLNALTEEEVEELIRSCIPEYEPIIQQGNGDLTIRCPFHDDHTPSCSVSPSKRCFQCFGCKETGSLTDLIKKFTGSKAIAYKTMAAATGQTIEFHEPDAKAIAKYDYRDAKGKLKKQVLRFPRDADGNNKFVQRRPSDGGWINNVDRLGPMLYHAEMLTPQMYVPTPLAGTAIIVEGEKDADTVTDLHLRAWVNMTIGVTSGGSGTWDAKLAKCLNEPYLHVIIMPDNDRAGADYAEAVRSSLEAEGIEYKMVSLHGTGAKDVTEYMAEHTVEDLVRLIDSDWVRMPDGRMPDGLWPLSLTPDDPYAGQISI